jgi:mono/diheme cytochrome c family protein
MKAVILATLVLAAPAMAAEETVILKPGAGLDAVNQNCSGCHSLDYVHMNAPFLNADAWKAEVGKMRTAFGAQITDDDAAIVQQYLVQNYGAVVK